MTKSLLTNPLPKSPSLVNEDYKEPWVDVHRDYTSSGYPIPTWREICHFLGGLSLQVSNYQCEDEVKLNLGNDSKTLKAIEKRVVSEIKSLVSFQLEVYTFCHTTSCRTCRSLDKTWIRFWKEWRRLLKNNVMGPPPGGFPGKVKMRRAKWQ